MEQTLNLQEVRKIGNLEILAKQVVEGFITGLHKSPFHGFSVEFSEHRLYNPGESVKNIDWKLFARTDKLFVKRYEEETNLRCQLVIDASSSMYFPKAESNKMEFSVYCAAAIMQMLKKQRDAVGLSIFSNELELQRKAKSSGIHHQVLLSHLENLLQNEPENRSTSAIDALHQIAEAVPKRSLVVIFSDMLDSGENAEQLFSALQHLRYKKHEVILFHVVDKRLELDFEYTNRPHIFIDMETGEKLKLNPVQIKEKYMQSMNEFKQELKLKCAQYRIDFVEADINEGFKQVLLPYLVKRSKMM